MIQATLRGSSGGSLEGPECLVVFRLVFWSFFSTDFSGSWKKVGLVAYNHPTGSIYHLYTTYKIILYTTYTNWQYIPPIILWCFFGVKIYIQYHYPLKKVHLRGPWKEEFMIVALLLSKGLKIHPGKLIFWTQKIWKFGKWCSFSSGWLLGFGEDKDRNCENWHLPVPWQSVDISQESQLLSLILLHQSM